MPSNEDSDHPIVDCPWEYEIVLFCYHVAAVDWEDSYIDMTLRRGSVGPASTIFRANRSSNRSGFPPADRRLVHPRRSRTAVGKRRRPGRRQRAE